MKRERDEPFPDTDVKLLGRGVLRSRYFGFEIPGRDRGVAVFGRERINPHPLDVGLRTELDAKELFSQTPLLDVFTPFLLLIRTSKSFKMLDERMAQLMPFIPQENRLEILNRLHGHVGLRRMSEKIKRLNKLQELKTPAVIYTDGKSFTLLFDGVRRSGLLTFVERHDPLPIEVIEALKVLQIQDTHIDIEVAGSKMAEGDIVVHRVIGQYDVLAMTSIHDLTLIASINSGPLQSLPPGHPLRADNFWPAADEGFRALLNDHTSYYRVTASSVEEVIDLVVNGLMATIRERPTDYTPDTAPSATVGCPAHVS